MFYTGDLQSGISLAMQEAKLVGCFVTDDGDESQLWEKDYLQDGSLKESLAEQTVLLRLVAGSQEAGFLAAIYPLPKTPTFVLIKNGELKEYITSGVSKEDFLSRLAKVLDSRGPTSPPSNPSSSSTSANTSTSTNQEPPAAASAPSPDTTTQNQRIQQQTAQMQATLAERSRRLEAQKKEQDAAEKAKRAADAKARKEAAEAGNPRAASEQKYAKQQAQRQREAREERQRILKRVEDDKAERREREAKRKAEAQAKLLGEQEAEKAVGESSASAMRGPARGGANAKECAVQVRLFDGSTIRSRFPSTGSLLKDVRPWVDEKQEGDAPYTFKQVLSPLPNKNIEMAEEERSLAALGLTPSATLILVPVTGYTSAYDSSNAGIVSRVASGGYSLLSSSVGMVTGALGGLLGGGVTAPPAPAPATQIPAAPVAPAANTGIRTLGDQRKETKKDNQEFYNGNATNFQPRPKDEDEGKND